MLLVIVLYTPIVIGSDRHLGRAFFNSKQCQLRGGLINEREMGDKRPALLCVLTRTNEIFVVC